MSDPDRVAIMAKVIDQLTAGISLREICSGDLGVTKRTIQRWIESDWGFKKQYQQARRRSNLDGFEDGYFEGKRAGLQEMFLAAQEIVRAHERILPQVATDFLGTLMIRLSYIAERIEA